MIRILLADDSKVFVNEAVEALNDQNWHVKGVYDGNEAIEALSDGDFDAVVLDRSMPGLSGDDVLRWIRSRPERHDLCVIMLTAYGDVSSAVESLKLGAFQYLLKPLQHLGQLRSILAAGIALHKAHATRKDLLIASDRVELIKRVRSILTEVMQPDGVHILFVGKDGSIDDIFSEGAHTSARGTRPFFVHRVMAGDQIVFEQDGAAVASLQPISSGSGTLMAVPVLGPHGTVIGILDIESIAEHAFDPCWSQVLRYLADLVGIGLEVEAQTMAKAQAQINLVRAEADFRAERETRERITLLVRELGHRILTPLQVIGGQAEMIIEKDLGQSKVEALPDGLTSTLLYRVGAIRNSTAEIASVCEILRDISRETPISLRTLNLWELVESTLEAYMAELGEKHIAATTSDGQWRSIEVTADPGLLRYSLECLLRNAIEAIEETRKKRRVSKKEPARIAEEEGYSLTVGLEVVDDERFVSVSVSDNGSGVPSEHRGRLFSALFSTKKRPSGGSSLFRVSQYMRLQGGSIELGSDSGRGATFILKLPLLEKR